MRRKPGDSFCVSCGCLLPLPEPSVIVHGGRPKKLCARNCRRTKARRVAAVAMLRVWAGIARVRGDESQARRYEEFAAAM